MTQDTFRKHGRSLNSQAEHVAALAPGVGTARGHAVRALRRRMRGGGETTLANVVTGTQIPLRTAGNVPPLLT